MQGDSIRVTLLVPDVFEKMGVRYAVGGSLSSSLHGVMRATFGKFILATNELDARQLPAQKMLSHYKEQGVSVERGFRCLLYTSPSPRD